MPKKPFEALASPQRTAGVYRILFRMGWRRRIHDFDVRVFPPLGIAHEPIFAKLDASFALLAATAPVRWRELRRDIRRILVTGLGARGEHVPSLAMCLIDGAFLEDQKTSVARVAGLLVHEGAHARLSRRGIPYDARTRARVERVCTTAELLFLGKLRGAHAEASEAIRRLELPALTWSDQALVERENALLGGAGWLGRLALRLRRSK